jgi:uncharacterized repeat protein (TIGR03803 family)
MKTYIKNLFLLPALVAGLGLIPAGRVTAQTFTNLHSFNYSDGANPQAGLILSGNTLYGTAYGGGSSGRGMVFAVNTDGTGFTNLHSFTAYSIFPSGNNDGANPQAGLILSGTTLYGTAVNGGSSGQGTVFAVSTDGTGFTNLHSFNNSDGANPQAGLILSGNTLYGTAYGGGSSGAGTVFAVSTDGTGFTNLYSFTYGSDGVNPQAGLILSGNTLYGTACRGGSSGQGTVFAVHTNGMGFTNLHSFTYVSDGANPRAGLILSGNTLYGTASVGGSSGQGTVFSLSLGPPAVTTQPVSQTVNAGQSASFTVTATGVAPLSYQWRKDGVNVIGATSASLTLSNVQTNQAGNYAVVITNIGGSVTSSVAGLTVNRLAQTINFVGGLPAKRGDDAPFDLSATASSGLPVSYTSSDPGVATVSGNTVTITGFGYTIITASQAGNATNLPAASVSQTLHVAMAGTVVAWGWKNYGQTNVPAGLSGVVTAIAAGYGHTVTLKNDGTVVAWGYNGFGQTNVPAGLSGVTAIAAGLYHTVTLKTNGTVVAWGNNDDHYGYYSGQTSVPVGLSGVTAIAAGAYHTVALKTNGTVVAWGYNSSGETNVPAGLSGVTAIAAGYGHTVTLKNDGTVVAWGYNGQGQTDVPAGLTNVTAIAAGDYHTVALKSDGTVVAWGAGKTSTGNLEYGQSIVPAGLTNVTAIAAGAYHTVALKSDGTVVAWGYNDMGQTNVPAGLSGVTAIAAGAFHTVAIVGTAPQPQLTIIPSGANVILTWPTNAAGFTLQSTTNLVAPAVWSIVSPEPIVIGGQNAVVNPISGTQKFYRLSQ